MQNNVVADGTDYSVLEKLVRAGAIHWVVNEALTEWSMVNGKANADPRTVHWQPTSAEPYLDTCAYLSERVDLVTRDADSLAILWRQVALTECRARLQEQVEYYQFGEVEIGEKTDAAMWYALQYFSISQVWGIINSAARYAAAQRQARTKEAAFAPKLIASSITGYVDRAIAYGWTVYPRARASGHDEPTLTSLLFDRVLSGVSTFQNTTSKTLAIIRGTQAAARSFYDAASNGSRNSP